MLFFRTFQLVLRFRNATWYDKHPTRDYHQMVFSKIAQFLQNHTTHKLISDLVTSQPIFAIVLSTEVYLETIPIINELSTYCISRVK